jgi:hypothetical protein
MQLRSKIALLYACLCLGSVPVHAEEILVVHEWGTFTSIQDNKGENLHGYFINSEPVPAFVHSIPNPAVLREVPGTLTQAEAAERLKAKGLVSQHPDVIVRLETPVMYFYPPRSARLPLSLDVKAGMRGGWLTEYYPQAETNVTADDVRLDHPLRKDFIGTLSWRNLKIGGEGTGPQTTETVWAAPRKTQSARVLSSSNESEKYLFYRGVGNIVSPLRVSRNADTLYIDGAAESWDFQHAGTSIEGLWLVDIDNAGRLAFRQLPPINAGGPQEDTIITKAKFKKRDYSAENLRKLEQAFLAALTDKGLYEDEARAMLATWQSAYFKTPGTRLFFIVPRPWVDHYLPLEISVPAKIERVMVGRIELLSKISAEAQPQVIN